MCSGQQQFFRVTPTDVHVGEGRTAVINCAVENRAGRVQWTKDGLTLGKKKKVSFQPHASCCDVIRLILFRLR